MSLKRLGYSLRLFSEGNVTLRGIWEVQSRNVISLCESVGIGPILSGCDNHKIKKKQFYT